MPMTSLIPWRRRHDNGMTLVYLSVWHPFHVITYYYDSYNLYITVLKCTSARVVIEVWGTNYRRRMEEQHSEAWGRAITLNTLTRDGDDWES